MQQAKILIVDDDEDFEFLVRQKFRDQIKSRTYIFEFASNGRTALDILAGDENIDLILTDLNMPEMDGLALLEELNKMNDRVIKSIVISAFGDMNNIRKAMNLGAFDFITKPIAFEDMEATIEKARKELKLLKTGKEARENIHRAILDKEKAEQSEKVKKEFYDNITHEFRTPLTLILGPAEKGIQETRDEATRQKFDLILRNGKTLLRLINELLDISRIEAGSLELTLGYGDIKEFIKEKLRLFKPFAEKKKIGLELKANPKGNFLLDFDDELIGKVLNNLLSNAFKFTPEGGQISLSLENPSPNEIRISVKDSGIGIPENHIPYIFDRYYQVKNTTMSPIPGSGIGLALTRGLIHLCGGEIEVRSIEGLGTEFIFTLPVTELCKDQAPLVPDFLLNPPEYETYPEPKIAKGEGINADRKSEKIVILIIEDNADIRAYLRDSLAGDYIIQEAEDGYQGLIMAREEIPDLIICDVMMPKMDGFQVTRALKEDFATSHIPIIILTAKNATESKIEGLGTGADDYLTKPFNPDELLVRIKNLIGVRAGLHEKYKHAFFTSPGEVHATSMEDEFLLKVKNEVEKHLDDELYSVEGLAYDLGMSRTQLHRKLKALTGKAASQYIRSYRLDFAMNLLKSNAGTVSEIAYKSGFGSPSYFTKCFSAHFNLSPKDVKKLK